MTSSSLRRQMKNIVNNYSEAEIKVREATSNDPWGPSSSLMAEISDLTYNVVAFSEIMSMIWKRLNDHGKNWRHVYKALMLMDYLIKTGSERVAQQCKENVFAIQTLKDFQYIDRDGRDQGINVREKSKQLIALLKDDERLRVERSHALKTKERMSSVTTAVGSNNQIMFGRGSSHPNLSTSQSDECGKIGGSPASYHGSTSPKISSELEQTRPQTSGEEELQLQLALAMSREEAEQIFKSATTAGSQPRNTVLTLSAQDEQHRRGDDLRLQLALEESRQKLQMPGMAPHKTETALLDLTDSTPSPLTQKSDPWGAPLPSTSTTKPDPWAAVSRPVSNDPWKQMGSRLAAATSDPWGSSGRRLSGEQQSRSADPWGSAAAAPDRDPWAPTSPQVAPPFHSFSAADAAVTDEFSVFSHLRGSPRKVEGQGTGGRFEVLGDGLTTPATSVVTGCSDVFDMPSMSSTVPSKLPTPKHQPTTQKNPESFLGPNASLVNLDTLITHTTHPNVSTNPFLAQAVPVASANPFHSTPTQMSSSMMAVTQTPFGPVDVTATSFSAMPRVGAAPMVTMPAMQMPQSTGMQGMMGSNYVAMAAPPPTGQSASSTNPFLL
ncbi:epsin-2-like isoform X2 [Chiloscyllium punctatum]|uniref:epsin-2-like isoform X2 n=1 Tax=Chiloscyllium punctatum TaxID=137246 RepID=UPI003B63CE85